MEIKFNKFITAITAMATSLAIHCASLTSRHFSSHFKLNKEADF